MAFAIYTSGWVGTAPNGRKGRLVLEIDDLPAITSGTTSINVVARWHAEFSVRTDDTANTFRTWVNKSFSGTPTTSGAVSINNTTKQWNIRVQTIPVTLAFGSDTNLTLRARLTSVENIGLSATVELSANVSLPRKPWAKPLPPLNFMATLTGGNVACSWDPNYTSASGAYPWASLVIYRNDDEVAELPWSATSWTDTNVPIGGEHTYWIASRNQDGGRSAWVSAPPVATKPSTPTGFRAVRSGGDVSLSCVSDAHSFEWWHSTTSATAGFTLLGSSGEGTYQHLSASLGSTHWYRVYAVASSGAKSDPVTSSAIAPAAPPNAPTGLLPNGVTLNVAAPIPLLWSHNPVDGTAQSSFSGLIRSSVNGGATWSSSSDANFTKTASAVSAHTLPASMFAPGTLVEWRVRTWGYHANPSPYGPATVFSVAHLPSVTINTPTSTLATNVVSMGWTATDQVSFVATLRSAAGVIIETITGTTARSVTFATKVVNATGYKVGITVTAANGLTSALSQKSFTTSFTPPAGPVVVVTENASVGQVVLSVTNAASSPVAVSNDIYRDGVLVAEGISVNTAWTDRLPYLKEVTEYRVDARAATGVTSSTVVSHSGAAWGAGWFFVNYGPGFAKLARARLQPSLSGSYEREVKRHNFVGRTRPLSFYGSVRERVMNLSFLIEQGDPKGDRHAWWSVVDQGGIVCLRDPLGRRMFGSISKVNFPEESNDLSGLSFTFEEDSYVYLDGGA